jgi:hypothetical protein
MASVLAVSLLYEAVRQRFADEGIAGDFSFGWYEPPKQKVGRRTVVFVPGDPSGNVGAFGAPRMPGGNPRPLAVLDELLTIVCDAYEPSAPELEHAQYEAARLLLDDVFRAIYLAAHGRFAVKSTRWIADKNVRRKGAAIEMLLTVQGVVPDAAAPEVGALTNPPLAISAEVSELDHTTTVEVEPPS